MKIVTTINPSLPAKALIWHKIAEFSIMYAGNFIFSQVMAHLPAPSEPKAIRSKLQLSQSAFAGMLGVSLRTLQDWEQGRRQPQGPAITLLRIAEQHPNVFVDLK